MKFLWLFALSGALLTSLHAVPSQVIVIRHGEKPKDKDAKHLAPAGWERAERLVVYLKNHPELTKSGMPDALIAAHTTKDGGGQRTAETLEPLAKELNLPIETPFESEHSKKLAALLRNSKDYDGKIVLVCWTHERIPELIEALGIHPKPPKLPDDSYDRVYLLSYADQDATMQILAQDMPSVSNAKASKLFRFGKKKKDS